MPTKTSLEEAEEVVTEETEEVEEVEKMEIGETIDQGEALVVEIVEESVVAAEKDHILAQPSNKKKMCEYYITNSENSCTQHFFNAVSLFDSALHSSQSYHTYRAIWNHRTT